MSIEKVKSTGKKVATDKDLLIIEKLSKENLEKDGGLLSPVLYIYTSNKTKEGKFMHFVCPLIGMEPDNKREMLFEMGKKMDENGILITKVIFAAESWCLKGDKTGKKKLSQEDVDKYYKKHGSIAKHPNRTEALILCSWKTKNNTKQMVMQPFSKTKTGKIKFEDRIEMKSGIKGNDAKFFLLEVFFKGYLIGNSGMKKE